MKQVTFLLPIGAEFTTPGGSPIRHLGKGQFIGELYDMPNQQQGTVLPGQEFGTRMNDKRGAVFEAIPCFVTEDPLDAAPVLAAARAPMVLMHKGKPVLDSDQVHAILMGTDNQ